MTKNANKNKTVLDLNSTDCRWPFGDPRQEGFYFCGDVQVPGRPYCIAHCALSFEAAKARQPAPAPLPIRQAA